MYSGKIEQENRQTKRQRETDKETERQRDRQREQAQAQRYAYFSCVLDVSCCLFALCLSVTDICSPPQATKYALRYIMRII